MIRYREQGKHLGQEQRPTTLKDIAALAGVSVATVSVILSNGPKASAYAEKTRRIILDLAREYDYSPNLLARSLKSGKTRLIGVVMASRHSTYYGRPLRAAERCAAEMNYEIITADMKYDFSRFEQCINMMLAWKVEGIILMTGGKMIDTSMYDLLQEMGIPYIKGGVQHPDDPCSTIVFNSHDAGRLVARHLFELDHREIVVVAAPFTNAASEERIKGVLSMAKDMNVPEESIHLMFTKDTLAGFTAGYTMMEDILKQYPEISAALFHNDKMAIGAMRLLHEKGIAIPQDIAVAGFDDMYLEDSDEEDERIGSFLWPALTTVRTPLDEIGAECVRLLINLIKEHSLRSTPRTVVFPPKMIIRESTGTASIFKK